MYLPTVVALCGFATSAMAVTTVMNCVADNCLRAIRGSAFPTRPGTADCSSYFITTVTPATVTSTVTSTDTTVFQTETITAQTDTINNVQPTYYKRAVDKRSAAQQPTTVVPTSIPAYASPCSGSVRYSSACSCIGLTATTTTAPTPTYYVTQEATAVATIIPPFIPFLQYSAQYCQNTGVEEAGVFVNMQCTTFSPGFPYFHSSNLASGTCANTNTCRLDVFTDGACQDLGYAYRPSEIATSCSPAYPYSWMLVCPDC